jgi:hypothetical protein
MSVRWALTFIEGVDVVDIRHPFKTIEADVAEAIPDGPVSDPVQCVVGSSLREEPGLEAGQACAGVALMPERSRPVIHIRVWSGAENEGGSCS